MEILRIGTAIGNDIKLIRYITDDYGKVTAYVFYDTRWAYQSILNVEDCKGHNIIQYFLDYVREMGERHGKRKKEEEIKTALNIK